MIIHKTIIVVLKLNPLKAFCHRAVKPGTHVGYLCRFKAVLQRKSRLVVDFTSSRGVLRLVVIRCSPLLLTMKFVEA